MLVHTIKEVREQVKEWKKHAIGMAKMAEEI